MASLLLLLSFFHFKGGDMNKVCKLNIVNLNKQAKLFSQGMHPVIRIGDTGKWERMKESPSYDVSVSFFFCKLNSFFLATMIYELNFFLGFSLSGLQWRFRFKFSS